MVDHHHASHDSYSLWQLGEYSPFLIFLDNPRCVAANSTADIDFKHGAGLDGPLHLEFGWETQDPRTIRWPFYEEKLDDDPLEMGAPDFQTSFW